MAKRKKWADAPWQADPSFAELFGGKSGNAINGRGEKAVRKPERVFWLAPSNAGPFGRLQDTVVDRHNSVEELYDVYANCDRGPKTSTVADKKVRRSPEDWTEAVKDFVLEQGGDQVGVASIDPNWVYEGFEAKLPYVIMIVVAMDHSRSAVLPSTEDHPEWVHEVAVQYNRGARVAALTTQWIKNRGYDAKPHAGPWVGSLNLIPAAIAAGLGELGKHGSLINRDYGSSFRLAAVETEMPLLVDRPERFGADEFCLGCQVCTNACPPQAISTEKEYVRGDLKWYVDFDRCIGYFNETFGCAICIAVCPWSTPGRAPRLAEKWTGRMGRADA